jgi:hypothetical protein
MKTNIRELNTCLNCAHSYDNGDWDSSYLLCNYNEDIFEKIDGFDKEIEEATKGLPTVLTYQSEEYKKVEELQRKKWSWLEDNRVNENTVCDDWEMDSEDGC